MSSFFVRDPKKLKQYQDTQKQNAARLRDVSNGFIFFQIIRIFADRLDFSGMEQQSAGFVRSSNVPVTPPQPNFARSANNASSYEGMRMQSAGFVRSANPTPKLDFGT